MGVQVRHAAQELMDDSGRLGFGEVAATAHPAPCLTSADWAWVLCMGAVRG